MRRPAQQPFFRKDPVYRGYIDGQDRALMRGPALEPGAIRARNSDTTEGVDVLMSFATLSALACSMFGLMTSESQSRTSLAERRKAAGRADEDGGMSEKCSIVRTLRRGLPKFR
jgi:hypothetical protein